MQVLFHSFIEPRSLIFTQSSVIDLNLQRTYLPLTGRKKPQQKLNLFQKPSNLINHALFCEVLRQASRWYQRFWTTLSEQHAAPSDSDRKVQVDDEPLPRRSKRPVELPGEDGTTPNPSDGVPLCISTMLIRRTEPMNLCLAVVSRSSRLLDLSWPHNKLSQRR
jgi:hypothetical protein